MLQRAKKVKFYDTGIMLADKEPNFINKSSIPRVDLFLTFEKVN